MTENQSSDLTTHQSTSSNEEVEENIIISGSLSDDEKLRMEVITSIITAPDRKTYGKRLKEGAEKLEKSVRTVQRLIKKYEDQGLFAVCQTERADKGSHRVDQDWVDYIIKTYKQGNRGDSLMTAAQIVQKTGARADELGIDPPSHMTVYRVLKPLIKAEERKQKVRNPGWHGSNVLHKTSTGQTLAPQYSNHTWQCDHTEVDVMLVDQYGKVLSRPWLTKITDSYSTCIIGMYLSFDAPSSQVVALALRHAILPKHYGSEFSLRCEWGTYGVPENLFTDRGKDFKSNHLRDIAFQLGFQQHFRDRPSEGGIEERSFGTFNTRFFRNFLGYVGSNIQERPKTAEENACFTLQEMHRLLVRFIVDQYNQRPCPKDPRQTRFQRWQAGLLAYPTCVKERELDMCLLKKIRRTIYRGGYIQFANQRYRGDCLVAHAHEAKNVAVRYDPTDLRTVWVYGIEDGKEKLLGTANILDQLKEPLSLTEVKAHSNHIRQVSKSHSDNAMHAQIRDLDETMVQKDKSKRQRKQEEKNQAYSPESVPQRYEQEQIDASIEEDKPKKRRRKILNFDELREDYD